MGNQNHYVYITTNLINGKQYVGDHTINDKEKGYYIGSGDYFIKAVKKYGENNFMKIILEWFENRKEASLSQEKYIKQYNTLKPNGYNISPTGGVGMQGCHSDETKKQIALSVSKKMKGRIFSDEHKKRLSIAAKLRTGEKNSMFGKLHSEYSKEKNRQSNLGKISWNKGLFFSEDSKKKMSESHKGKIPWNKN